MGKCRKHLFSVWEEKDEVQFLTPFETPPSYSKRLQCLGTELSRLLHSRSFQTVNTSGEDFISIIPNIRKKRNFLEF